MELYLHFSKGALRRLGLVLGILTVLIFVSWAADAGQPDLQVGIIGSPNPISPGQLLTYQLALTNTGDAEATSVGLTTSLSSNVSFISAAISQGTFSQTNGTVTFDLGSLPAHGSVTGAVTVVPAMAGTIYSAAVVSEAEPDGNPADNSASSSGLVSALTFSPAGNMLMGRYSHTATLLQNGKVLITGGITATGTTATAELFDPAAGTSVFTADLSIPRASHVAAMLSDGRVILVGNTNAEIYDPATGTFTKTTNMATPRLYGHTVTLLSNGRVLIAGGYGYFNSTPLTEIFNPANGTFTNGPSLRWSRKGQTATRLTNDTVLIAGGQDTSYYDPIEGDLFQPDGLSRTYTANWYGPSSLAASTLLPDGRVLLTGGFVSTPEATLFDPATKSFAPTGKVYDNRFRHVSRPLTNGTVLICGGIKTGGGALSSAEIYFPGSGKFSRTVDLQVARDYLAGVRLPDGRVLVTGGMTSTTNGDVIYASTEIYDPANVALPPTILLDDASASRHAGTIQFHLSLSAPMGVPVTVSYSTIDNTAHAGQDYTSTNGTVTFAPGTTNQVVNVPIIANSNYQPDLTFSLALANETNAFLGAHQATGLIINDNPRPAINAQGAAIYEGNAFTNFLTFSVELSAASFEPISVDYYTSDATALAGLDYYATNGTLNFDPGVRTQTVTVTLRSDIQAEPDKAFYLNLSNAVNSFIGTTPATGTILNDDGIPGAVEHFSFAFIPSPEHERVPIPVTITAKDVAEQTVTNFSGGVTIWAALTNVPALEFGFDEGDFSQWTPLNLGNSPGPYQIVPFDLAGHGSLSPAFRLAPNAGAADGITRPIILQGGVSYNISADLAFMNENSGFSISDPGTAHVLINTQEVASVGYGSFFTMNPLQILRTNLSFTFTAPSNGTYQLSLRFDRGFAETEIWNYADNIRITAAPGKPFWTGPFTNGVWTGNYPINTTAHGLSLLAEDIPGHAGASNPFDVDATSNLILQFTNTPALLRAGSDANLVISISNSGPSTASNVIISNTVAGDVLIRSVAKSQGTTAVYGQTVVCNAGLISNGQNATVTITVRPHVSGFFTNMASLFTDSFEQDNTNNSAQIALYADLALLHVNNTAAAEGSAGTNNTTVTAWLEGPVGQTISADYATTSGTATSGSDYLDVAGTIVFAPDVVTQFITVPIIGDVTWEPNESFNLLLSNPVNASLAQAQSSIIITNDDPFPSASIADISLLEGNSGSTNAAFQVTLSNPSASTITLQAKTSDGTATGGSDYASTTATINFAPGTTNQVFNVPVFGDVNNESNQTFFVTLSSPVNCSIGRATAIGTIINDDAAPGRLYRFAFDPVAGPQYPNRAFPITVRALDSLDQPASFSGPAFLTAQSDQYYVLRFLDDFEDGDAAGWTNFAGASMVVSNANDFAAAGNRSIKLSGRAASSVWSSSFRAQFSNSQPNKVSFYVRGAQSNLISGRAWGVGNGYRTFDFFLGNNGKMGLNSSTGFVGVAYTSNRWYKVDINLDWTAHRLNCSIDGALTTITNVAFLEIPSSGGMDTIAVQNTDAATSWFDNIQIYQSGYSNLLATPSTLNSFVGGVWTGQLSLSVNASNAYLTITDNNEHTGKSVLFDVLPSILTVVAPVSTVEGSGPVPAQVTLPAAFAQPILVTLTSSAPSELAVPPSITIPAGQTNANFDLTIIDDTLLDGTQPVTITATASNFVSGSTVVSVDDNESAALSLTLPSMVAENAGVLAGAGKVSLAAMPGKPLAIKLTSSDTNVIQVPASVLINTNQTNASFNLTVVDNGYIDGTKTATISTAVANWTNDSKLISVSDNEDSLLRLSGPSQLSEEMGSAAYTVRLSGKLTTNLDVSFFSSNTNSLIVAPPMTIVAGQTSVMFTVSIVDNVVYDGARQVALSCSAAGFTDASNVVTVLDNEIHHLGFGMISSPQTSSVPFSVTISARDILDGFSTAFNGPVSLSVSGQSGSSLVQPANVTLVNGTWSGTLTVFSADSLLTLHATSTNGLSGTNGPFTIVPPSILSTAIAASDLAYSPASARLWALVGANNTLVPIDPFRGLVETAAAVGPGAGRIVTSGDGHYLHIVAAGGTMVKRFDTLIRSIDLSWTNSGLSVEDLAAQPGNSAVVAVSWACPGCSPRGRGVSLYENGIAKSNVFGVNTIEFGETPGRLYGYNNDVYGRWFALARVDASGIVQEATVPILGGWTDEFTCAGGLLFARNGTAYDPETATVIGSGNGWWNAPADKAAGRLYSIDYFGPITAYDLTTLLPVDGISVPNVTGPSALIRWGTNGLAFSANGKVVVMRTTLLPTAPPANIAVSVAGSTNFYVRSGDAASFSLQVANRGPNAASNTVLTVLLPPNVSMSSPACAQGFFKSSTSNSCVCAITNLPVNGSATVSFNLQGGAPGTGNARIGLTADSIDPDRSDNVLNLTMQTVFTSKQDGIIEMRQPATDLFWDAALGRIVVAVQNLPLGSGSSLLLLDPQSGRFEAPIPTGQGPNHLSVHPAGRYAYASLDGESSITRVDFSNHVADLKFATPHQVADLAVKPDDAEVVVATVYSWPQVLVYQSGAQLPHTVDPGSYLWDYSVEFSSTSPTLLYSAPPDALRRIQIDANGATLLEELGGLISGFDRDMRCSGGRVFTAGGRVFDPETKTLIGTVPYGGLVAPDAGDGRAFYLNGSGANYNLTCLDFTNLQMVSSIAISNIIGTPSSLIRWGNDGLAFRTTGGQIFVIRTTLADDRDSDGLGDAWEFAHFGGLNAQNGGPNDDPDNDGFTNLQEYRLGLDPLTYDSPRIMGFERFGNGSFHLSVLGLLGQSYALMASTNLADWTPLQSFVGSDLPVALVDSEAGSFASRFYRFVPLATVFRPQITVDANGLNGSGFDLKVAGVPGVTYRIESSTNLINWQVVTNFISTNSSMHLRDTTAPGVTRQFYRAATQ